MFRIFFDFRELKAVHFLAKKKLAKRLLNAKLNLFVTGGFFAM